MSNTNANTNDRTAGIDGPSNAELLARGDVFNKCDRCGRWNVAGSPHQCPTADRASVMNSRHREERRTADNERNDPTDAVVIAPDGSSRQRAYHKPRLNLPMCDGSAAAEQPENVPWVEYNEQRGDDHALFTDLIRPITSCPARLQREGAAWKLTTRERAQENKCYPCLDCHPEVKAEIQTLRDATVSEGNDD